MKDMNKSHNGEAPRIIISGGGTGGHIFPAVSIANAIKELRPDAEMQDTKSSVYPWQASTVNVYGKTLQ